MAFDFSISTKAPLREIQNIGIIKSNNNFIEQKIDQVRSNIENVPPSIPFITTSPRKISLIGSLPNFPLTPKALLGQGQAKTVWLKTAVRSSLNKEKMGWRDVADSSQLCAGVGQEVEKKVLNILASDPEAKKYTPKIYYVGMKGTELVTTTKVVFNGDTQKCLPYMSSADRLRLVASYAKSMSFLHSKNIIHNDTALRNVLIEWPVEEKKTEDALNCRMARPIFDADGKTLIDCKELITLTVMQQLEDLKISQVKVFANKPPIGLITDFDRCTFVNDLTSNIHFGCPIDCSAPERMLLSNQYKKLKDTPSFSTEELQVIKDRFRRASSFKSDLFSFGQLLCDAILRPELNTNLAEKTEYNNVCKKRIDERIKNYEDKIVISAIDPDDYTELAKIDLKLAELAFKLMSYQPHMRPSMEKTLTDLDEVIAKFPVSTISKQFYDTLFKSYDDAKTPPSITSAFNMFAAFSNEPFKRPVKSGDSDSESYG